MKAPSSDFNLLIFTHEIFQQSILNVSFRQFEENLNSTSDGIYVERPVDILIHITPATTYRASLSDFYSYWEQGISFITINFSLFTQNHPVPCKVLSPSLYSSLQSQSLKIYHQDHSKNILVLSKTTVLSVESKYLNGTKLQFRLSFGLNKHVAENDLPFNEQLIANEKEKYIRVLMDRNRYVPSALPTRYVESQIVLKQLVHCACQTTELTPTSTLLTFTIQNMHPKVILELIELEFHLQQLMVQYEKILQAQKSIASTFSHANQDEEPFEEVNMNSEDEESQAEEVVDHTGNGVVPIEMIGEDGNQMVCAHKVTGERHIYTREPLYNAFELIPIVYPVPSMYLHQNKESSEEGKKGFFMYPGQCKRFAYRIDAQSMTFAGWYSIPWSLYYQTIIPNKISQDRDVEENDISLVGDVIDWSVGTCNLVNQSNHQTQYNIDTIHTHSTLYALLQLHHVCWFLDPISSTQAAVFSLQPQLELSVEYPTFLTLQEEFTVTIVIRNKAEQTSWSSVKLLLPSSEQFMSLPNSEEDNVEEENTDEVAPQPTVNATGLFFPVQEALLS
jgi:hypothetical protein